jgi:hypothetical protein
MHLDLRVLNLDAEVSRLIALGARHATDDQSKTAGSSLCSWTQTATNPAPLDENPDEVTQRVAVNDPVNDVPS